MQCELIRLPWRRMLFDLPGSLSTIAGWSAATTLARLLLLSPLSHAHFGRPQLATRNVIDDVALQIAAQADVVVTQLAGGAESFFASFEQLGLPVSSKSKHLCSSSELDEKLQQAWSIPSSSRVTSSRNSGTDAPLGARRGSGSSNMRAHLWGQF
ncbi:unnamed protein product [Prorocentrum cordatum]|uniref:Uncharacterized protein n=1 Tax=Prorocentrum cordatum TaxID=2364126 RepID=A0ABN9TUH3_9DINO|nr:unnamed protein product [Polarella glacialis]